jgi:hypothetical protein
MFFQFGDGFQDQARVAAESVELVNEKLIELAAPGSMEDALPLGRFSIGTVPEMPSSA